MFENKDFLYAIYLDDAVEFILSIVLVGVIVPT